MEPINITVRLVQPTAEDIAAAGRHIIFVAHSVLPDAARLGLIDALWAEVWRGAFAKLGSRIVPIDKPDLFINTDSIACRPYSTQ